MNLTSNEKKTLKFLLANSRISDSEIALKLKISSQAVGKIRRKLDANVIESYSVNLSYSKLGIKTFAIGIAALKKEGLDLGELEVEQKLLNNPHIINLYRLPKGSSTYVILYGFKDMIELDSYFHSPSIRAEIHNFIELKELFPFSHNSLVKNSPNQLFNKTIDDLNNNSKRRGSSEFENFKKRL